mmetsp:Transcript_45562/g.126406  ORF Transcript_45562/g.126406 Transcript_45562/m.126406 type:complete len:195 (+) Transcript_45562:550-1134(+)|eukprot:3868382-Prymnesium_polylepis.2
MAEAGSPRAPFRWYDASLEAASQVLAARARGRGVSEALTMATAVWNSWKRQPPDVSPPEMQQLDAGDLAPVELPAHGIVLLRPLARRAKLPTAPHQAASLRLRRKGRVAASLVNVAPEMPPEQRTKYLPEEHGACPPYALVYTQHKTGNVMVRLAVEAINRQLPAPCPLARVLDYNCPPETELPRLPAAGRLPP